MGFLHRLEDKLRLAFQCVKPLVSGRLYDLGDCSSEVVQACIDRVAARSWHWDYDVGPFDWHPMPCVFVQTGAWATARVWAYAQVNDYRKDGLTSDPRVSLSLWFYGNTAARLHTIALQVVIEGPVNKAIEDVEQELRAAGLRWTRLK